MEIADIFVVNKSDRDGAESFASHLRNLAHTRATEQWENPVILTQADQSKGIELLAEALSQHEAFNHNKERQILLFAEKSFAMIQEHRMRDLSLVQIQSDVRAALEENPDLNLFEFIEPYFLKHQS
jgi:LAO/AO transport system kinase